MTTDKDHISRLRKMLDQVNPGLMPDAVKEQLETLRDGQATAGNREGLEAASLESQFVLESLDLLRNERDGEIDSDRQFVLEAIVMPYYRPVIDIVDDKMQVNQLTSTWFSLGEERIRRKIEECFLSVGRIDATGVPYGGTGFIVGDGLVMTNRHVAMIFAQGIGTRSARFQTGGSASINFYHELGRNTTDSLTIEEVLMIHPYWDMALLKVNGLDERRRPLPLCVADPDKLLERAVVVVGYPGFDPYGDDDYQRKQNRIFRGTYSVKRVQPGLLKKREVVESYKREVDAVTHDCSTLGGNSGSAVLVLPNSPEDSIEVVGLHFAGAYLHANYAVPSVELARDSRVVNSGVKFAGRTDPRHDFYGASWASADSTEELATVTNQVKSGAETQSPTSGTNFVDGDRCSNALQLTGIPGTTQSWSIPLHVSISFGPAVPTGLQVTARNDTSSATKPAEEWLFRPRPSFPEATYHDFDLKSLTAEPLDWKAALSTALASKLAYENGDDVFDTCRNSFGFDSVEFIEAEATECFVAMAKDVAVVAFRGTQGFADWLVDFSLLATPRSYGRVHRGFFGAFQVVKETLEKVLGSYGDRKLCVTGHSLGGALATIAAAEWQQSFPISAVYTFGQPAVGKREFAEVMRKQYSGNFIRFVNDDDFITRVPPNYQHIGRLYHFDARGNLRVGQESFSATGSVGEPMMTDLQFDQFRMQLMQERVRRKQMTSEAVGAAPEGLLPGVNDHGMSRYIEKIAKKVGT